jgi:hypothetical protein
LVPSVIESPKVTTALLFPFVLTWTAERKKRDVDVVAPTKFDAPVVSPLVM